MARTDDDSWDLASSVGATATMVAARPGDGQRRSARPDQRPVRRAAGPRGRHRLLHQDARRRAGSVADPRLLTRTPAGHDRRNGRAHQVLRRLPHGFHGRRCTAGGDPGLRAGRAGIPAAVAGRHRGLRARSTRGHRVQDADADGDRRAADRHAPHHRDRSARGLARRHCADAGFDPAAAHRMDGRGAVDLPAARSAGPAVRRHHRAVGARQHRSPPNTCPAS